MREKTRNIKAEDIQIYFEHSHTNSLQHMLRIKGGSDGKFLFFKYIIYLFFTVDGLSQNHKKYITQFSYYSLIIVKDNQI